MLTAVIESLPKRLPQFDAVLWTIDEAGQLSRLTDGFEKFRFERAMPLSELPNIGVLFADRTALALVDVASIRGPMSPARIARLRRSFEKWDVSLELIAVFQRRNDLQQLESPPWGSVAWFLDDPDHFVHF